MRWLTLYARARQVPASFAAVVIITVTVWVLGRDGSGSVDPRTPALILAAGAMAVSAGFSTHDADLDRTAAIRWVPRRAAHVLLAGAFTAAVLLAVQTAGPQMAPAAFVLRDSAGLLGLAALGAALMGGLYAWALPLGWFAVAFLSPPEPTSTSGQVLTWMLLPPGTPVATWSALTLTVVGTAAYAVAGPRR